MSRFEVDLATGKGQCVRQAFGVSRGIDDDLCLPAIGGSRRGRGLVGAESQGSFPQAFPPRPGGDLHVDLTCPAACRQGRDHKEAKPSRPQHGDSVAGFQRKGIDSMKRCGEGLKKDGHVILDRLRDWQDRMNRRQDLLPKSAG